MAISDPAFTEFSQTDGILRMELMGHVEEIPHTSVNYLGPDGIGCAEMDVEGKINYLCLSNTTEGVVMTMVGEADGPMDLPIEGYAKIMCANADADFSTVLGLQRQALEGMEVLQDEAWLKEHVPGTPQRATSVMAEILPKMMGMMEGMVETLGDTMQDLGEAMGEVIGGMAKGIAKAFGGEEVQDAEVEEEPDKIEG